jgi:hypothetical protein
LRQLLEQDRKLKRVGQGHGLRRWRGRGVGSFVGVNGRGSLVILWH